MSYDIAPYDKQFLSEAIESDVGDWTAAPAFPATISAAIEERLIAEGYKLEFSSPDCREWIHAKEEWGLQISVFSGEISFAVPYGDDWENAAIEADNLARKIASEFDLGLHDSQRG